MGREVEGGGIAVAASADLPSVLEKADDARGQPVAASQRDGPVALDPSATDGHHLGRILGPVQNEAAEVGGVAEIEDA